VWGDTPVPAAAGRGLNSLARNRIRRDVPNDLAGSCPGGFGGLGEGAGCTGALRSSSDPAALPSRFARQAHAAPGEREPYAIEDEGAAGGRAARRAGRGAALSDRRRPWPLRGFGGWLDQRLRPPI